MEMNSPKKKIHSFFQKTTYKIVIILMLPVLVATLFFALNNLYHLNSYKSLIISNYTSSLNGFFNSTEEKMDSIITATYTLPIRSNIEYAFSLQNKPTYIEASQAIKALAEAKNSSTLIDSVTLYNKNSNFIISENGVYDDDTYFNTIYPYEKYPSSFWVENTHTDNYMKILPPTSLRTDGNINYRVVPMIVSIKTPYTNEAYIIYNININKLFEEFSVHKFTPNTKLYLIDNSTLDIYTDDTSDNLHNLNLDTTHTLQSTLQSQTGITYINGEKHLCIQSTKRFNIWGYTYLLTLPYRDISRSTHKILFGAIIFIFALCCTLLAYMFFGTKYLYAPWHNLAKTAQTLASIDSQGQELPTNLESYINNSLLNMATTNRTLEDNLANVLPLSQKQYLISILNDNYLGESSLEQFSFKYDYFSSISISISINPAFIDSQPHINKRQLDRKIRQTIYDLFAENFITYEISTTNNILYLLLNLENDSCASQISDTILSIKNVFSFDTDNVEFIFGAGNIYCGIDGLKLTHQESMANIMKILGSTTIQFNTSTDKKYTFTLNNENVLINYIISGHTDKAKDFIINFCNNASNIPLVQKSQIYIDIISALDKFVRQKNINLINNSLDYVLEQLKFDESPDDEKYQSFIFNFIDLIASSSETNTTKIDISSIISYIEEHYADDFGLKELATMHNTTEKYLSKRIKQYLNISFKDYLTQLRIDKAKELLETTNITISELHLKVGFQNRGAFTRAFKLKTGLSATEYKNAYNKNNQ